MGTVSSLTIIPVYLHLFSRPFRLPDLWNSERIWTYWSSKVIDLCANGKHTELPSSF